MAHLTRFSGRCSLYFFTHETKRHKSKIKYFLYVSIVIWDLHFSVAFASLFCSHSLFGDETARREMHFYCCCRRENGKCLSQLVVQPAINDPVSPAPGLPTPLTSGWPHPWISFPFFGYLRFQPANYWHTEQQNTIFLLDQVGAWGKFECLSGTCQSPW